MDQKKVNQNLDMFMFFPYKDSHLRNCTGDFVMQIF